MHWLVFAFCGPVLWAISVHLDKYLVERFFKDSNVAVLLVFTAFIGVVLLPLIWAFEPDVTSPGLRGIAVIALSGVLYMGGMLFYLRALQSEEASVVAPFFQASPLFGYALGYLVLGERLSGTQIIGGALIILGGLIVSIRFGSRSSAPGGRAGDGHGFKLRLALLMLACGFVLAIATLIFKIFAVEREFWPTTFWMFVGEAIFGVGLLVIPSNRRQFIKLLHTNTAALLSINASNELINLAGGLIYRYALLFAPLSLVQAIGSTTTLFVFVFGVLLSIFGPEIQPRENIDTGFGPKGDCRDVRRCRRCADHALNGRGFWSLRGTALLVAGDAELRARLIEIVRKQRHAEQIGDGAVIVQAGRFGAQLVPVVERSIAAAKPGERHQVDLLVDRHRVHDGGDFLNDRIILVVLEHRNHPVIGRV